MASARKKNSCFLARPENNFETKQTYFNYSPNKGFHPPEFQAKLFFTQNWMGGFYWDCLLKPIYICNNLTLRQIVLNGLILLQCVMCQHKIILNMQFSETGGDEGMFCWLMEKKTDLSCKLLDGVILYTLVVGWGHILDG